MTPPSILSLSSFSSPRYPNRVINLYLECLSAPPRLVKLDSTSAIFSGSSRSRCYFCLYYRPDHSSDCSSLSVVKEMRLADGTLWPMPITLDVNAETAAKYPVGSKVALIDHEVRRTS